MLLASSNRGEPSPKNIWEPIPGDILGILGEVSEVGWGVPTSKRGINRGKIIRFDVISPFSALQGGGAEVGWGGFGYSPSNVSIRQIITYNGQ